MTGKKPDLSDDDPRDDDLRARFSELRREEEAEAPVFVFPSPGRVEQNRRWVSGRLIAVGVCALVLAAVLVLRVVSRDPQRNVKTVASITEWKSPTDFLLETPGSELLRNVPAIGVWHDYAGAAQPGQKDPHAIKQVSP